jgi:hypothetical protein
MRKKKKKLVDLEKEFEIVEQQIHKENKRAIPNSKFY